jgi:hypothetical protein
MSRRKFGDVERMINDLLDRHEANPRADRLLAYIDEDNFSSVEARDRFTAGLLAVEKTGGINVQRKRVDGALVFGHVRLADAAPLYAYAGRVPARVRVDEALGAAQARQDLPSTAQSILEEIADGWSRGVSRYGLSPHDDTGLAAALDLARALYERAADVSAIPTDFRTFSRSAGTDSKALERLTSPVVRLFRRLYPAPEMPVGLDANDALATFGIVRTPQALTLSGPVSIEGLRLPRLRFYGVPPEQGDTLGLAAPVDHVLTIENYTSFVRHAREVNEDKSALVVYTAGFPSRAHLRQIVRLAELSGAPVYHWGDIDGGGVKIFCHLERALANRGVALLPHLMDPALLHQYGVTGEKQLRVADAPSADSAMRTIWDALLETGLVLEQESLAPRLPGFEMLL